MTTPTKSTPRRTTSPPSAKRLEKQGVTFLTAEVDKIPQNTVALPDEETIQKIQKLLEMLEDNDDVQNVYHNAELPEEEDDED